MKVRLGGLRRGLCRLGVACAAVALWIAGVPEGTGAAPFGKTTAYAAQSDGDELFDTLAEGLRVKAGETQAYETPDRPTVYLTFDDGPSKLTPQVLDILKREKIQATFFVLGEEAEGSPEVVKRIADEGHAVGNHTYDHVYISLYGSYEAFFQQVEKTDAVLEKLTGRKPELLRAPGGTATNFDAYYFYMLERAGYRVMDWNVDSGDALRVGVPAKEIVAAVKAAPLEHEMNVLLHDGRGHGETVKALPEIIDYFREAGYDFAPIGERVKPTQFRLLPLKWKRSYTREGFAEDLRQADRVAAERRDSLEDARSLAVERKTAEAAQRESAEALAELKRRGEEQAAAAPTPAPAEEVVLAPPLRIGFGGTNPLLLEAQAYDYGQGRLTVPLRLLADRLGARYSWSPETGTAVVLLGELEASFDAVHRTVQVSRSGFSAKGWHLADIYLRDGELMVPLRATSRLFGSGVMAYSLLQQEYQVELAAGLPAFEPAPLAVRDARTHSTFALFYERLRPRIS